MKKLFTSLVALIFAANLMAQTSTAPTGTGSAQDPYLIETLANLYWVSIQTNNGNSFSGKYFLQTQDIDASITSTWSWGQGWNPIGYATNWQTRPFSGIYNGNGKTITGIYINRPTTNSVGLFGRTSNSTIINLNLENATISGGSTVGGMVGMTWQCVLSDSSVSGSVSGTGFNIGGLVGNNSADINRCSSTADVTGGSYVGGLIGWNYLSDKSISNSFSAGNVSGTDYVGGFLGHQNWGGMTNCYARGDVTLTASGSTTYRIGGFAGNSPQNQSIINSYSTGNVVILDGSTHTNKGFNGSGTWTSAINFFDLETSGQSSSPGATPKTTAEMHTPLNFLPAGWDFKGAGSEGIWNIGNDRNDGYPYFVWEYPDDPAHPDANQPFVSTINPSDPTTESVVLNGTIIRIGDPPATQHGFCWNTAGFPSIDHDIIELGAPSETGDFSAEINVTVHGLQANTVYYFRAYASNPAGTIYGQQLMFVLAPYGAGTEGEPFLIESLADLLWISMESYKNNTFEGSFFLQTDDIDASATEAWHEGSGWMPINFFNGFYNGNGKLISSLHINRPQSNYVGLFNRSNYIQVSNLGMVDCNITGNHYTGAIIGGLGDLWMWGEHTISAYIKQSFSSGSVAGNSYVGGIAGYNSELIENTYSVSNVYGNQDVGGITSRNEGVIHNTYSKGEVIGNDQTGGLVSENTGEVSNSFWDTETSGLDHSAGGSGKSTAEMNNIVTFLESGWLFKGVEPVNPIWNMHNDKNDNYPYFDWQFPDDPPSHETLSASWRPYLTTLEPTDMSVNSVTLNANAIVTGKPNPTQHGFCWNTSGMPTIEDNRSQQGSLTSPGPFTHHFTGLIPASKYFVRAYATNTLGTGYGNEVFFITPPPGSGTEEDPYLIYSLAALEWMSLEFQKGNDFSNTYFLQTAHIDASATAGFDWMPIGLEVVYEGYEGFGFNGNYDGQFYSISNLTFNSLDNWEWDKGFGLFGAVGHEALLKNIILVDVSIETYSWFVGGLAAHNRGTIFSCSVSGLVHGSSHYIGSIAGYNEGTISSCFSDCAVVANGMDVGGISGYNGGLIQNTYFSGTITGGGGRWGGVAGWNDYTGILDRCYTYTIVPNIDFSQWSDVGPVYGANYGGIIQNCYWDITVYNFAEPPPHNHEFMTGARTTDEMTSPYAQNTYVNWDFDEIWAADQDHSMNNGYPYLLWQDIEPDSGPPIHRIIQNETLTNLDDPTCYDALETITVSDFVVEAGAQASLIAGQSITLLPGTRAHLGSYLLAYIAPDGPFCGEPEKHFLTTDDMPVDTTAEEVPGIIEHIDSDIAFFKMYPNPTKDVFTLELHNYEMESAVVVEVYGMRGDLIKRRQISGHSLQTFSLEAQQPGIYLVRITQGEKVGTERIIKR